MSIFDIVFLLNWYNDEKKKLEITKSFFANNILLIVIKFSRQSEDIINALKSNGLINIRSTVFIINEVPSAKCENASKILKKLSSVDLINSYYVCLNKTNNGVGNIIYTSNLYSHHAPNCWKIVTSFNELSSDDDHRWTFYNCPLLSGMIRSNM